MSRAKINTIKPNYYDTFQCSAAACPMTCCQEWKIAVDDDTYQAWRKKEIEDVTMWKDECRVIRLNEEHLCPFLSENQLCKLVIEHGEEILSNTCHIFPREIHTYDQVVEYTLMPSCPEVVDRMNQQADFRLIQEEAEHAISMLSNGRAAYIALANREDLTANKAMMMIFYLALEGIESLEGYEKLVEDLRQTIEDMEFNVFDSFEERNELFLDLIENYRKEGMYQEQLEPVAQLAESYSEGYDEDILFEKYNQYRQEKANFEKIMKLLLAEEIYAELSDDTMDQDVYLAKLQWLAIELAVIEQWMFLLWDINTEISYEDVRTIIVVIFRMTGYDDEDIIEYLENSFETLVWEWGYLAMILG